MSLDGRLNQGDISGVIALPATAINLLYAGQSRFPYRPRLSWAPCVAAKWCRPARFRPEIIRKFPRPAGKIFVQLDKTTPYWNAIDTNALRERIGANLKDLRQICGRSSGILSSYIMKGCGVGNPVSIKPFSFWLVDHLGESRVACRVTENRVLELIRGERKISLFVGNVLAGSVAMGNGGNPDLGIRMEILS